jgi:hypothetical protein
MILALNGADFDFGDFGKAVASAPVAALQRAIRDFGKSVRDSALTGIVVDGLTGPKTAAAANRMLTKHIGVGQVPAELRTGALTPAQVAANADTITKLVNTEARRRGFGIYVGPPIADKAMISGKTADVAGLQIALKNFGKNVGDKQLAAIVNDGKIGPKTVAAANRMLVAHIGANQAPAILRTGKLTQAQVLVEAARITQLINTEARRRGYGIYIGPPATQKALTALKPAPAAKPAPTYAKPTPTYTPRREPAAKAPVVKYIPPSQPASREPSYVPTTESVPSYTPSAMPTPVVVPTTKTYVVPPSSSGGMDVEKVVKWSAIGLGVVALLGGAYFLISRRRQGAAPAVAGFGAAYRRPLRISKRYANEDAMAYADRHGYSVAQAEEIDQRVREARMRGDRRALPALVKAVFSEMYEDRGARFEDLYEGFGASGSIDNAEREQWIQNDEGLYNWYQRESRREKGGMRAFIQRNKAEIDAAIRSVRDRPPRQSGWRDTLLRGAGGYYHTAPTEFTPGQRVQLHPGMSLWMQGARYGTVKKIGRDRVYVEIDATGKTVTIPPTRLQIED